MSGTRSGPWEPHDEQPMTRTEFERAFRNFHGVGNAPITVTYDDIKRIAATVEHGWALEEPTSEDLDRWAAIHVMGWEYGFTGARDSGPRFGAWFEKDGTHAVKHANEWKPSRNLGTALRVFMETDVDVSVDAITHEECGRDVKSAIVVVGTDTVHDGAFDEEAIARKIMVELWRRLERSET